MTSIHPTAIVSPDAEIADDCEIGPYCIIGPKVTLGRGCVLMAHVVIQGPATIGQNNRFHPFCSIGGRTQDLKYKEEPTFLEIGDDNDFRECCTANRGTSPGSVTRIGSRNHFLAYAHVAHDCLIGNDVIFSNNGTVAGHVEVQDFAVIGGLSGVHQFCRIGAHAIVGGCTKIVQDVPPFMIADGNPAAIRGINQVGLERRGFTPEQMRALKEAYRLLYRSQLRISEALEKMRSQWPESPLIAHLASFVESSKRGIVR